jgi:thymidine kinase
MKTKAGKLTVIVGSMFSGKSTELQRQGKRKEIAGQVVAYFKPKTDNRYNAEAISTHDGSDVEAYVVSKARHILGLVKQVEQQVGATGTVCVDEVQFFDTEILYVIETLLRRGVDVVVSGLDLDRFGEPFGVVPTLMAQAEEVVKVRAVCQSCGSDAYISAGKFQSDEQVVVGEKESYIPLCRSCYYEKANLI